MEPSSLHAASVADNVSLAFVGRWNELVSTTNWEKGRIICEWREAAAAVDAPVQEYSDEAWATRVGGVTSQHVGRLRRVYERFGKVQSSYNGLYWSHFRAVLDWHDAEMWLEGAVQNGWTVTAMCAERAEAVGGAADASATSDELASELDEDSDGFDQASDPLGGALREVMPSGGDSEAWDESFADDADGHAADEPHHGVPFEVDGDMAPAAVRPFDRLPQLPPDLDEAFESMKLAILRHKLAGWQEVAQSDVTAMLDGLRQLALAPRDD